MKLLSMTMPDWNTLLENYSESLGYNPLTGTNHHREPHVYMGCLDFSKSITEALQDSPIILNHYFVSMIDVLEEGVLLDVLSSVDLSVIHEPAIKRYHRLVVFSGTLRQWRDSCHALSQKNNSVDCRNLGNEAIVLLERAGFRDMFKIYTKQPHPKGGFYLA